MAVHYPDLEEDRAYHDDASSSYVLPKDSKEHSRLEAQAQALETLMGGDVFHAPIDAAKVTKALDIGCGTGYVTDKLACKFPQADVYGLDLSPVPRLRQQRSNVHFLQGNVITQKPTAWSGPGGPLLTEDEAVFDYIFSRLLIAGITDWPGLVKQEFALIKSGGYVEHHEIDFATFDANDNKIENGIDDVTKPMHLERWAGLKMKGWIEDAGFVDVKVTKYRLPMGGALETDPAMKEFGDFWYQDAREGFVGTVQGAARKLGTPATEVKAQIDTYDAWTKPDVGNYTLMYAVYGRKP